MKIAAIDIGTNTLLMTIGEYMADEAQWKILCDLHHIARLGEGVDAERNIQPQALARAVAVLNEYKAVCEYEQVERIIAVTTSAVRDANNRTEVLSTMSHALGAEIAVISGEDEARYSFLGGAETNDRVTVMDIGGGSTEFITGEQGDIIFRTSTDMGAVRITERFFSSTPPSREDVYSARVFIRSLLTSIPSHQLSTFIGVGGTFTSLAAIHHTISEFTPEAIHRRSLSADAVHNITDSLLSMTLDELQTHPCIHPKRADILPAGALILSETLSFFQFSGCIVSTKGLRYGLLYDSIIDKSFNKNKTR